MLATALLTPLNAFAHSFGEVYLLPLPFERYAWGAAAVLGVSFVMAGMFLRLPAAAPGAGAAPGTFRLPAWPVGLLRMWALALLVLAIASGWWGTRNPYANFNMTLFWVGFLLGFAYLTVLIGDLFALINPWRTLAGWLARPLPGMRRGVFAYPPWLGVWPAAGLWLLLVWVELFGHTGPRALALLLAGYTVLTLLMAALFGIDTWFRRGEVFGVWLNLLARLAPVAFDHERGGAPRRQFALRWPGQGLLDARDWPPGTVMLMIMLLATTAFDGLHDTELWHRVYWLWLYPEYLTPWVGSNPLAAFPTLRAWYGIWNSAWLLALPLGYLAVYASTAWLTTRLTPALGNTQAVMHRFAPSLLPIVLAYHASHYYTLLQVQGPKIVPLLSDPFGWQQNWFGTAGWLRHVDQPDVYTVWDAQIALILLGHVAAVVVAHRTALQAAATRHAAAVSQLPMLALMIAFTVGGLWLLSQPFQPA